MNHAKKCKMKISYGKVTRELARVGSFFKWDFYRGRLSSQEARLHISALELLAVLGVSRLYVLYVLQSIIAKLKFCLIIPLLYHTLGTWGDLILYYYFLFYFLWRTSLKTTYLRDGRFLLKDCFYYLFIYLFYSL